MLEKDILGALKKCASGLETNEIVEEFETEKKNLLNLLNKEEEN